MRRRIIAAVSACLAALAFEASAAEAPGFDQFSNQVWGATKGGYVFDRLEPAEAPPATGE